MRLRLKQAGRQKEKMSTSVRAGTSSIAPQIASPVGGLSTSVSSSIKASFGPKYSFTPSSQERSFGSSGLSAKDMSIRNPFAEVKHLSSSVVRPLNIRGEGGVASLGSKEARMAQVFGGRIEFGTKPAGKQVGFTNQIGSNVESNFARARARNQELAKARQTDPAKTTNDKNSAEAPNVIRVNPSRSEGFRGFQTIPQDKEPLQITTSLITLSRGERGGVRENIETPKSSDPIKRAERPIVRIPLTELKPAIARYRASVRRRTEAQQVQKTVEAVKAQPIPEPARFSQVLRDWKTLPTDAIPTNRLVRAIGVPEDDSKQITVDRLKISEVSRQETVVSRQAFQTAGIISRGIRPQPENRQPVQSRLQVEELTPKQQDILIALAPLIKEGDQAIKDRVYATVGVTPETAQTVLTQFAEKALPKVAGAEVQIIQQEPAELRQAVKVVRMPDLGITVGEESESEIQKKAQALMGVIRQTYQLNALGNNETDTAQLVERQLAASELVPQKMRLKVSSFLVRMVRQISMEELTKKPQAESVHQVDLAKQDARATLAIKSINEAPRNENGEIARDAVIERFNASNNEKVWGKLAILRQKFDGSYDEIIYRLRKVKFWEDPKVVAQTIDNSMEEFPAVEPSDKPTTKLVGVKEVGKVMDPTLIEAVKVLIKSVITLPQSIPAKS